MSNKTILVVEDENSLAFAIAKKLEIEGFETLIARSAEDALGALKDTQVDAIWLDHYLLGKMHGLDLVVKLKNDDEWKKIPIFVVSNTASADKVEAYIKLGIDKYYTKSDFRLDQIIDDIKKSIEK